MTVSVLRTADAWWVETANGAARIATTATTTRELLADRVAIENAAHSADTVPVDSLRLLRTRRPNVGSAIRARMCRGRLRRLGRMHLLAERRQIAAVVDRGHDVRMYVNHGPTVTCGHDCVFDKEVPMLGSFSEDGS